MDILQITKASLLIKKGDLVAFPTETVYGLGANALNPEAVAKIFAAKERPSFDPLIVHIANIDDIAKLTTSKDKRIYQLAEKFWPGPLTIVLPKSEIVPDIVTSGLPTVGIRMPNNPIALELIKMSGCPIAAPSANKFGLISPTNASHVKKQLPSISCVLDGGPTTVGIESTVITLNPDGFLIMRDGFITQADLEEIVPLSKQNHTKESELASPGLLKSHYSPQKPIFILGQFTHAIDRSKAGFISFSNHDIKGYKQVEFLSKTSDLKEAAENLFKILHKLEDADIAYIIAEPVPNVGIGAAIMDRLTKAAYRYCENK